MSILNDIAKLAPTVATALGGPLAGSAASFVLDKLGVDYDKGSAPQELEKQLQSNPESLLELKRIELEWKKFLAEKDIKIHELDAADRDSARQRQVALKDHTPTALAALVVPGFFVILYMVMTGHVDGNVDKMYLGAILGTLNTVTVQIFNYYFGSSKGSKDKTAGLLNK